MEVPRLPTNNQKIAILRYYSLGIPLFFSPRFFAKTFPKLYLSARFYGGSISWRIIDDTAQQERIDSLDGKSESFLYALLVDLSVLRLDVGARFRNSRKSLG